MNSLQTLPKGLPARDAETQLHANSLLQEEMQQLAAINKELMGTVRADSGFGASEEPGELALVRAENAELRARVAELEQALMQTAPDEETWTERQKEYEALLDEKSEVIRALYLQVQELQDGITSPTATAKDGSDSQRLKKEMDEQRRQLQEDEESVMQQMRQMEMAMSRDRAELARQRNEVQRLHNELNHEIEIASRDPGLRERLVALQRLQGEITGRKQTANPLSTAPAENGSETPTAGKKKSNGLLGRIFGK